MSGMSAETYLNNEKSDIIVVRDQKPVSLHEYSSAAILLEGRMNEFNKQSTKSFEPSIGWD